MKVSWPDTLKLLKLVESHEFVEVLNIMAKDSRFKEVNNKFAKWNLNELKYLETNTRLKEAIKVYHWDKNYSLGIAYISLSDYKNNSSDTAIAECLVSIGVGQNPYDIYYWMFNAIRKLNGDKYLECYMLEAAKILTKLIASVGRDTFRLKYIHYLIHHPPTIKPPKHWRERYTPLRSSG